jgi:hypothetical protein
MLSWAASLRCCRPPPPAHMERKRPVRTVIGKPRKGEENRASGGAYQKEMNQRGGGARTVGHGLKYAREMVA